MKKIVLIKIFALLLTSGVTGQVWIEPGAVWHYDYWHIGGAGFYKIEYVSDTIINGKSCQKLIPTDFQFTSDSTYNIIFLDSFERSPHYTHVSGDTVFYYRNNQFFILYNFGANIGDTWLIATDNNNGFVECQDSSYIEVIDTGSVFINGSSRRTITVQPTSNSAIGFIGTMVERFGSYELSYSPFQFLFPTAYQCDSITSLVEWGFFKFKCFEDQSFSMHNPSGEHCEYLLWTDINEIKEDQITVYAYQNQIFFSEGTGTATIYNLTGQRVHHAKIIGNTTISLDGGIYLVRVTDGNRGITRKVYLH